jgi:hypothetical protein
VTEILTYVSMRIMNRKFTFLSYLPHKCHISVHYTFHEVRDCHQSAQMFTVQCSCSFSLVFPNVIIGTVRNTINVVCVMCTESVRRTNNNLCPP